MMGLKWLLSERTNDGVNDDNKNKTSPNKQQDSRSIYTRDEWSE